MLGDTIDAEGLPRARVWKFGLPVALGAITIVAGTIGTYRYFAVAPAYSHMSTAERLLEAFVTSFAYFGLGTGPFPDALPALFPAALIARLSGGLLVFYAAALGLGMVFASRLRPLELVVHDRLDRLFGEPGDRGHVVVCGLGETGTDLAVTLAKRGERVVAVEQSTDSQAISRARNAGVTVFSGDATQPTAIEKRAKVTLASEVYVTCGDDETNAAVVQTIAESVDDASAKHRSPESPICCYANVRTREHRHHLHAQVEPVAGLRLHSYDAATATARELLGAVPVYRFDRNPDAERAVVVLVGWTELTRAVLTELCYTMHYGDSVDRSIHVICDDPGRAEAEFIDRYPGLDPTQWEDDRVRAFVDDLFAPISFHDLPGSDERVVTATSGLLDEFSESTVLTVVVDAGGDRQTSSLVSLLTPHLDRYEREHGMDTHVLYHSTVDTGQGDAQTVAPTATSVTVEPFTDFWDGCDPEGVRGDSRDDTARQLALFYHLLYDYDPASPASSVDSRLVDLGVGSIDDVDDALAVWRAFDRRDRSTLETLCWGELAEHYRDANRHAADHAGIKRRLEERFASEQSTAERGSPELVERLAALEHRRWCAEKFLGRWTPLSFDRWDEWDDETSQERLRDRRVHRDLWPLAALEERAPGEFEKDVAQVRFVLEELTEESG